MKVYVDANDIGKTVTYKEEYGKRQYLYVHDNEGFIFKDLADYTKQVRKEVCEEIISKGKIKYGYSPSHKDGIKQVLEIDKEILDQIQGETK